MTGPPGQPARPILAILAGELAPYRLHFHQRVARELTALSLRTITHFDTPLTGWAVDPTPDVGPVRLGDPRFAGASPGVRAWRQYVKARAVRRWLSEHRPAAVVVGGYVYAPAVAAIHWCHARGTPVFLWSDSNIHGDRAAGLKRRLKTAYLRRLFSRLSGGLPCASLGRAYMERYGLPRERIWYCPNEPDYTLYERPDPARERAARDKHALAPGRRRFVCSARLIELKRFGDAIRAFAAVADRLPDWDLLVVGDGPMRAEWEAAAGALLGTRVRFLGFIADQGELAEVYRACDCMVLPSRYEAWALVLNEALAAGLAVISSRVVGAAPELVEPGPEGNGALVEPFDVEGLSNAMLDVAGYIDRRRSASARVLSRWRREADPVAGLEAALRTAGVRGREEGEPDRAKG